MSQKNRLSSGGRIDRSKPLNFKYNGRNYQGYQGDSLASALLANGVDIVGRSFKYSRPRGIIGSGAEEPNAILQVGASEATQSPNIRATQQGLYEGLVCCATNGWPSVEWDFMSLLGKLGGHMMIPGFYYKTFMYPQRLWMFYEKLIRRAAGFGRSPLENDPDRYEKINQHCDVLVVGAGPAGLAAALNAAKSGARVILADEKSELGGSLLQSKQQIDGMSASDWVQTVVTELDSYNNVMLFTYATVNGYHDHNFLTIHERCSDHIADHAAAGQIRQRIHRVRAQQVILATGAQERPLVYANNDVPGNMLASAVSSYIHRYAVIPGHKLVLMTTNDSAYQTALDWVDAGREVVAIIDTRTNPNGAIVQMARERGLTVINGSAVIDVTGRKRVKQAQIASINATGDKLMGTIQTLDCDTIASSGGWSPVIHLSCHTGSRPQWSADAIGFIPGATLQKQHCAGAINGIYRLSAALKQGAEAGAKAAVEAGFNTSASIASANDIVEEKPMALFLLPHRQPPSRAPKQFVDFQNDVTAGGIQLAIRKGYESIEHVKRYTAMGFGTDQGKTANINGVAITAKFLNKSIPDTGTTIFRPNYTPVTLGAIAGRECSELFDPMRYTAMHSWHIKHGAKFEDVGQWKRPWYFPKPAESMHDAVNRECKATRESIGIVDASTLGKIDVQGPDAREFLNRIYTNAWKKLEVGKCRYGLMCGEDGMVFDDGVTSCLAENHFLMTTTTGGAARVMDWLEIWHQTEWPELQVYFNSVTDHWGTMAISGPNSRKLLAELTDINLDKDQFKFMEWREGIVADVPARVYRISFTGELAYEINVQANYALYVWEKLMEHGEKYHITPYGTETLHVLRAEKGFIIVGQDTDGSVTPEDLGMGWALGRHKPFSFLGQRGMQREDCQRENRKQLVGLKTKDPTIVLPEGAQIVFESRQTIPMQMVGHVTSSYWSANLDRSIAMGVVKGGLNRMGDSVYMPLADGQTIEAEICNPVFIDPEGERHRV